MTNIKEFGIVLAGMILFIAAVTVAVRMGWDVPDGSRITRLP